MRISIPYFAILVIIWFFYPSGILVRSDGVQCAFDNGKKSRNQIAFIITTVVLCIFTGFRRIIANSIDEYAYRNRWNLFHELSFSGLLNEHYHEFVFNVYYWLSARLFSSSQGGIFLTSLFITGGGLYVLRRDGLDVKFGLLLMLATGWFWETFNGIQQFAAGVMFFLCFGFAVQRKPYYYYSSIVACFFIHQASLLLFPLYAFNKLKFDRKMLMLAMCVTFVVLVVSYQLVPFLSDYLMTLKQYSDIASKERHGVKIITRAIAIVPAIIAYYFTPKIGDEDRKTRFCVFMTFIHAGIMLAAFIDTYIARFAMFTSYFIILFFARIGRYFDNPDKYLLFKTVSIIMYSIVIYMRMSNSFYYFTPGLWD